MSERWRGRAPGLRLFELLSLFIHFLPCRSRAKRPLPYIGKVGRFCVSQCSPHAGGENLTVPGCRFQVGERDHVLTEIHLFMVTNEHPEKLGCGAA